VLLAKVNTGPLFAEQVWCYIREKWHPVF